MTCWDWLSWATVMAPSWRSGATHRTLCLDECTFHDAWPCPGTADERLVIADRLVELGLAHVAQTSVLRRSAWTGRSLETYMVRCGGPEIGRAHV